VYELLVIDDDPLAVELVSDALDGLEFTVSGATDAEHGLEIVRRQRPPVVMLDLVLPNVVGLSLLEDILRVDPSIDVILFTGHYSTESAVEAIQKGAYDYLTKPLSIQQLRQRLSRWVDEQRARQHARRLSDEEYHAFQFEGIIGRSPLMLEVFSKIRRIAPHFQTALVTGETGTGKELVAKALHRLSPGTAGPFVVCNCAAIAETLFESELFGHVRGAFTTASQDKVGFVEAAIDGTLFLDEITEIPLNLQAKLLRLLQNREVQRVGASRPRRVDVRLVAASNRDLRTLVKEGKLREDLYYRLAMVEIKLPRLASRREDLVLLEKHFVEIYAERYGKPGLALSRRAQGALAEYAWPGNVRELENVLAYCCMMAEHETIDVRDLPEEVRVQALPGGEVEDVLISLEEMERKHARRVLDAVGGSRTKAAAILGVSRATLYRLLRQGSRPPDEESPSSRAEGA